MLVLLAERADTRNYTGERLQNWSNNCKPPMRPMLPSALVAGSFLGG